MADSVEIQFVDESEYQNEGKWYFYIENSQLELCADVSGNIFPFPSKTKNNFRGIDISQLTPLMSLSVPLFSLGSAEEVKSSVTFKAVHAEII